MTDATPLAGSQADTSRRVALTRSPVCWARVLALTTVLAGTAALAQPQGLPEIELERLTLNPSGKGSLLLGTGEVLNRGGYRFSLTGHYQKDPLVLFKDGEELGALVSQRVTAHLAAAYGLFNWLELGVQVPVLVTQGGDDLTAFGLEKPAEGLALGTPYLSVRFGLLSQADEQPVDLSIGAQVGLPLGSATALAKDGSPRIIPSVMVGRRFGLLRAALDAGLTLRSKIILVEDENIQDELGQELRLGAVLATTNEGVRGELNVLTSVPFQRSGSSVEALAGVRVPLSPAFEGYALVGAGVGDGPGTPSFRGLLGVALVNTPFRCVAGGKHTAEQCPDLDDDNDGVANLADTCQGVGQGVRVDAQGCPVKDTDGDGIVDPDDRCPAVPGVAQFQGCPDADGDGIEDSVDKCPAVAGIARFQGCPDTDEDGIEDSVDKCPTVSGIHELKGCPPKDTDKDQIPDHRDNCPNEPGPAANQGCPVQQPQLVEIQRDRIEIKDKVYFDSDKASILPRSNKLLDQVARIIIEHPELEKIWIEGHTDERGSQDYNRELSQKRAEEVRDYLVTRGVATGRLVAKGYGRQYPVASNDTVEGRAANRRVEFLTTPREGGQP
ncbi:OmpA family protein [Stigmatella sp. ncwal1]|uniref:OmpA family protein n=1 Tax=Stigmatella ashevillensis TaxID=2995309 RepID=A0ABT5DLV6_9BACT|nr:OmpA family protein [Stigmatella ashevillena]MDC0714125.1 OmpA family protein [Stigmatella ashevillena]